MAHIEAVQFFKNRKEETKKIISKYSRITNEAYLEDAYTASAKLYDAGAAGDAEPVLKFKSKKR